MKLLTVRGIPIRLHWSFLALLGFIGVYFLMTQGVEGALWGLVFFCLIFACVVLHELSHSLVAQHYGLNVREIVLLPVGGVASLERFPEEAGKEAAITVAGPLFNVIVGAVLFAFMWWLPGITFDPLDIWNNEGSFAKGVVALFQVNVFMALFNLIPAFPMDGGRLFRAFLVAVKVPYARATSIAANVSKVFLFIFLLIGIFKNPWFLLIALILYAGATGEEASVRFRSSLKGLKVRSLLPQAPMVVSPEDRLGDVIGHVLSTPNRHFPAVKNGLLIGVLCLPDLAAGLKTEGGSEKRVADFIRPPMVASPDDPLPDVQQRMEEKGLVVAVVVERGKLVGLVSLDMLRRLNAIITSPGEAS